MAGAFVAADASSSPPSPATEVGARWWGRLPELGGDPAAPANVTTVASIRDFGTVGCSTVWLAGGRAVRVHGYDGDDCEVSWSAAPGARGGAVLTSRRKAGAAAPLWQLTLPADGRAPAKLACAGACPLTAAAPACTPTTLATAGLSTRGGGGVLASSFAQTLAGAENTCAPSSPAPEGSAPWPAPPGLPLSYGLLGRFYQQVYGPAECASPTPWSWYGVPPNMEAGPGSSPRCVPAIDFRAPDGTAWGGVGAPPLDDAAYGSCFGATLAGWVRLPNVTDTIVFNTASGPDASYGDRFRVCVRFSSQVEVVLGGSPVALSSPDPRVDVTFVCQEITFQGAAGTLVPLSVRYAAPPIADINILQLWVIPVAAVYELAASAGGGTEVVYKCDACTPFSPVADQCCPPLGSCAYRAMCEEGGGWGGTPTPTAPPPETTAPAETTPGGYGTPPPPPSETTAPAETTPGGFGTPPPSPPETTAPAETTPPTTTTPGGYGTPPPTDEPAPMPPPSETPPATCPPGGADELTEAARRNWAAFQSAVAAAANAEELLLLAELV